MAALRPATSLASVPFVDLSRIHGGLRDDVLEDISGLIDTGAFTNGPPVGAFEAAYAEFCGTRACVGLSSGLDALRLALIAAGVGDGDEVLVPANTFIATFEAVTQAGARPLPVEVSLADYNLDVGALADAIGPRTRAILPVHLYGQMADMRVIASLARQHGLVVVEDACQAHGAVRDGLVAGTAGLAGAFSFYPGRTSAHSVTPVHSSRTISSSARACGRCVSTVSVRSTATTAKVGRRVSTRSRHSC